MAKIKVLVVDDNESILDQLQLHLQERFDVFVSGDFDDAVEQFGNEQPDILIVDQFLPEGKSGIDLVKELEDAVTVGILMTGSASKDIMISAIRSGIFDYFEKPLDLDEVDVRLKRAVKYINVAREAEYQKKLAFENQKLAEVGIISADLSHELLNHVMSVKGIIYMMKKFSDPNSGDPGQFSKLLKKLEDQNKKMGLKMKSLLRLIRRGTGDVGPVAVREIIEDVVHLMSEKFEKTGIDFKIIGTQTEQKVLCERVGMGQVLINLIVNAFHAIRDKSGDLWVEIEFHTLGTEGYLSVSDCGPGIDEEDRVKIFEPFFTTKPIGMGTGLGLSICQKIIESFNGSLYYDDSSDNTKFTVKLPLDVA